MKYLICRAKRYEWNILASEIYLKVGLRRHWRDVQIRWSKLKHENIKKIPFANEEDETLSILMADRQGRLRVVVTATLCGGLALTFAVYFV